jgi:hypothetical protein
MKKNDLLELIEKIEQRPTFYIGRKSIFCLRSFLYGVFHANEHFEDGGLISDFQIFIENRYNLKGPQSWAEIINFYSSNEMEAVDNFFELFHEFLNIKSTLENESE